MSPFITLLPSRDSPGQHNIPCAGWPYKVNNNSVGPGPEGSSPYLQEPATGPYFEPAESTPPQRIHSDPILRPTPRSSEWSLSFGLSRQNRVYFLSSLMRATFTAKLILLDSWKFRNRISFYSGVLLAPRQIPKLEGHPLSAVLDCLFNIFAATLSIWRSSLLSATWGRTMPWWQGTHLTWKLIHHCRNTCCDTERLTFYNPIKK
jgi:hypothetical protein